MAKRRAETDSNRGGRGWWRKKRYGVQVPSILMRITKIQFDNEMKVVGNPSARGRHQSHLHPYLRKICDAGSKQCFSCLGATVMMNLSREQMVMGSRRIERLLFTVINLSEKDKCNLESHFSVQLYSFDSVVLSSNGEWLHTALNEGSFGTKLRGNLLETEAIDPEEIQWWSYLRLYWLRCCCGAVQRFCIVREKQSEEGPARGSGKVCVHTCR